MKTIAILQARMGSNRLPGKVLMKIVGQPMLALQIERAQRAKKIDVLVVATSNNDIDTPIANLCQDRYVPYFRGSLDDVLERYYQAALSFDADQIVRLTGDCPLTDWTVIDKAITKQTEGGHVFTSNTLTRTWPQGLDVEVVTFSALKETYEKAKDPYEREHVLPYVWRRPEHFNLGSIVNKVDLSDKRWTVDEQADFNMISIIYEELYKDNQEFNTPDILDFLLKRPEVEKINASIGVASSIINQ